MTKLRELAGLDDLAAADDAHPVADCIDLREHVARQHDGAALGMQVAHAVTEDLGHQWVESVRGLVEQVEVHLACQRGDEGDLLTIALRVGRDLPRRIEIEPRDEVVPALVPVAGAEAAEHVDGLAARQ